MRISKHLILQISLMYMKKPRNVHSEVRETASLKRRSYRWLGFRTWNLGFIWLNTPEGIVNFSVTHPGCLNFADWRKGSNEQVKIWQSFLSCLEQKEFRKIFFMFCWSKLSSVPRQKQERKCWLWDAILAKPFQPPRKACFGRMLSNAFWTAFYLGRLMGKMLLSRHWTINIWLLYNQNSSE